MTLLHFDPRKPVQAQVSELIFYNFKKFLNKQQNLHKSFQLMKFDDKLSNK